jgi:hypothetical protein
MQITSISSRVCSSDFTTLGSFRSRNPHHPSDFGSFHLTISCPETGSRFEKINASNCRQYFHVSRKPHYSVSFL